MDSRPVSNRHIIDDALNTLATALSPFVANKTASVIPTDVSALLSEMLGRWDYLFHADLGYRGKNLVYEIRDIRNDWAHYNKSFDDDDTDRALDSIERLLIAIGAETQAVQVKQMKEEHRRKRYEFSPPSPAQRRPAATWPKSISIRHNLIGRGVVRRFEFNGIRYEVSHDELVHIVGEVTPWLQSYSWIERGGYSTSNPSKVLLAKLRPFALNFVG